MSQLECINRLSKVLVGLTCSFLIFFGCQLLRATFLHFNSIAALSSKYPHTNTLQGIYFRKDVLDSSSHFRAEYASSRAMLVSVSAVNLFVLWIYLWPVNLLHAASVDAFHCQGFQGFQGCQDCQSRRSNDCGDGSCNSRSFRSFVSSFIRLSGNRDRSGAVVGTCGSPREAA